MEASETLRNEARLANVAVAALLPQVLDAARALIDDERRWTKGAWARNSSGQPTNAVKDARCWCISGALLCAARSFDLPPWQVDALHGQALAAVRLAARASKSGWPAAWNDAKFRTHAEVLAALDRARLRPEGSP